MHSLRPVNLPSSLTICLPIVLVYSTYPPVSVLVRISYALFAPLFSDTWVQSDCPITRAFIRVLLYNEKADLPTPSSSTLKSCNFTARPNLPHIVSTQIKTNIRKDRNINRLSIHYARLTGLMLGSPNPQMNNIAEETLDISTSEVLTLISLLMPAFSLLVAPAKLSPDLHRYQNALLPNVNFLRNFTFLHLRYFVLASLHFRCDFPTPYGVDQ